jgi:hypothetical protein
VSATQIEGELPAGRCLIVHGTAREVRYGHPLFAGYGEYALGLYGLPIPDFDTDPNEGRTPEDYTGFIEPRRIYAQGFS